MGYKARCFHGQSQDRRPSQQLTGLQNREKKTLRFLAGSKRDFWLDHLVKMSEKRAASREDETDLDMPHNRSPRSPRHRRAGP